MSGLHMTPVQCQDDPFGFNAMVVYGDTSYPLIRCTPFISNHESEPMENNHGRYPCLQNVWSNAENNNNSATTCQMEDESDTGYLGQPNSTGRPVLPKIVDSPLRQPFNPRLIDVRSRGPWQVGRIGTGNYRSVEHDSPPEDDEKNKRPKKKKKVTRRNGKKSRRNCR